MHITEEVSDGLHQQLVAEVGPNHVLYGRTKEFRVVARRGDNDDILIAGAGSDAAGYIVHLVWNGPKPDPDPLSPWATEIDPHEIEKILGAAVPKSHSLLSVRH